MDTKAIVVRGAREHNLRNISLDLGHGQLIVFSGVSGSGKSSLAFDTLYAEGQRRYIESLSSYARQFLGQLPKPDVDYLGGLSPAVSIQQKTAIRNPRSTVGTITEIHDFLRVLFARLGQGHCPQCQRPITAQSREQIITRIRALPEGTKFLLLAPMVRGQKGEFKDFFADLLRRGYVRARVDGQIVRLTDELRLDKRIKHDIAVVVDRLVNTATVRTRLAEAVEQALTLADGSLIVAIDADPPSELLLSAQYACAHCQISFEPPTPQLFSFNSPHGMCPECDGLGESFTFDPNRLIPDPTLSFAAGAVPLIGAFRGMGRWRRHIYEGVARTLGIDLTRPWNQLPSEQQHWLLYGTGNRPILFEWKQRGGGIWKHTGTWDGIIPQLLASFKKTAAGPRRWQLEKGMRVGRCPSCEGQRLNPQARAVRLHQRSLVQVEALPISEFSEWLNSLEATLSPLEQQIARELLKEIRSRTGFLLDVGLHYLSLDRSAPTLSGGEAQRIRLASQIGSGLVGVLYILDEPSIGLHPRDNDRLLRSLVRLRDLGNTVIVVEHDEDTLRAADHIVDFGPGPGVRGGEVVASGSLADIMAHPRSLTGDYLAGRKRITGPSQRRTPTDRQIVIRGAKYHNLRHIDVTIPLGLFVGVTGVSGSGKSTLVNEVLLRTLTARLHRPTADEDDDESPRPTVNLDELCDGIDGMEHLDKVIAIDQSPIGRTPRSNPATYIKVFDEIRTLYAQVTDSQVRGYQPGRFSFNKPGGRCEACEGNGSTRLEMDFLADVWVTCPVCEGRRFNRETLQVRYRGKTIQDVLDMDVQQALEHFEHAPKVRTMLQTLHDVGLDYLKLGQPSPTLSGGEAQRIKLARELCRRGTGRTLYVLDEPTTGLHFEDIRKLLEVLHGFTAQGNTVLVIEHNLDVLKTADWLIDLGPEGGAAGGRVIVTGPPEAVARCDDSHTGQALRKLLSPRSSRKPRTRSRPARVAAQGPITHIEVTRACEHNLKEVSVRLPREAMTVCCGPSGSGKSSLALDTIYAEGQRRYVESLSSYARQFLGQVQKPKVEQVTGLSPAISIEQKTTSRSPRSTVGTITEVYDYLRVLYARLGQPYCPTCQIPIGTQTADEIVEQVLALPDGSKVYVLAPVERRGQEKYDALFEDIRRAGFHRIRVDGRSYTLDEPPRIDHRRKHAVEIVVDRLIIRHGDAAEAARRSRVADTVEQALEAGRGVMRLAFVETQREEPLWRTEAFSQHLACSRCGRSFEPLNPHHFSFNSPLGWCPSCEGLGVGRGANPDLLLRDPARRLRDGALSAWPTLEPGSRFSQFAEAIADHAGFSLDTPYDQLEAAHQRVIWHGTGDAWLNLPHGVRVQYKGLFPAIDEAARVSFAYRQRLDQIVGEVACSTCHGSRLRDDASAARLAGLTIGELSQLPLAEALAFLKRLPLTRHQQQIAGEVLREIRSRLQFLVDVGLDYLTLSRPGPTLSGGEAQRIRLASQIGSGLTGVLYVLDEPTIGLHPRDNARLLRALKNLRDLGNTLLLVEHDREVIATADHLLDFGPGAGDQGGEVVAAGPPARVMKTKASLTGQYLAGQRAIPVPTPRRAVDLSHSLEVIGARQHNLQSLHVTIPLGVMVAVTGVSGSGKSSLVNEVVYRTLARKLHRAQVPPVAVEAIRGLERIDKIINVDQDPIGHSPASNPATYTGVFDLIRQLYAQLPEAKIRGYPPARFSFNRPGGRCEACEGNGQKRIEMHFLPDVWVTCDVCQGARYTPETLAVRYKDRSIADVLALRVGEALALFGNIPKIRVVLQTLADVGLDYLTLGQSAPTLSGGEAQRVKLAAELARPSTGRTLYLLDEPTTGLHFDDIRKLLDVLHRLVDGGNTVLLVEHNLDVIKSVDWMIDIGPEAGDRGGRVVAVGPPEVIVRCRESHTGKALKPVLQAGPHAQRVPFDASLGATPRPGDLAIESVGANAKMPWEVDGPRWHTIDRVTTQGKPCHWDGTVLPWLIDQIRTHDGFSPPNWNHRSIVEVAAAVRSHGWFLHAMTGNERTLRLVFRVARNTFRAADLDRSLALAALDDPAGLEGSGQGSRVEVANRKGPWQEVIVTVCRRDDIDTPAFREFLRRAIESFQTQVRKLRQSPEDLMPWRLNGAKWHLGDKGFPPGRRVKWDRALLPRLLRLVRDIEPRIEVRWDVRDAITLRLPGASKAWGRWRTKDADALTLRFLGKRGLFNLARVEGVGLHSTIQSDRADGGDVLEITLVKADHFDPKRFQDVLSEHLRGFREVFAPGGVIPPPTAS